MSLRFLVAFLGAVLALVRVDTLPADEVVERAKIDALAAPLADDGWVYGMTVALVNPQDVQIIGYGHTSEQNPAPPTADTVFEIGSISKVFTGLLLAEMVEEKQVELDEPVAKLLGDSIKMPQRGKRAITLVDLATHSSGLPRLPTNLAPKDMNNPYADYTVAQLATFLGEHKLGVEPGKQSSYSNLGMGLLGHALAVKSGKSYEELVREKICQPLEMNDTMITLTASARERLAQGHDADGRVAANWDIPTLAGAGALRSTAADMVKFVQANLAIKKTPLDAAIAASHVVHFKNSGGQFDVALAWQVRPGDGTLWHNGGTGGYRSFTAFSPDKRLGVVVLSTTSASYIDPLGFELMKLLLTGESAPLKLRKAIELEAAALEPLVGDYKLAGTKVSVSRQDKQLSISLGEQQSLRLYPESKTRFFARGADLVISFESSETGDVEQLVLHAGGQNIKAPRQK